MAVLDVYNALTTDRPYRKALTKEKALVTLKEGKGTQFDPYILEVFINKILGGKE
jgi:HD-GYP domain-containing protein (c-di-GMP phosphodiesterase class II)